MRKPNYAHVTKTVLLAGVLTAGMTGQGWTSDKGTTDGWPPGSKEWERCEKPNPPEWCKFRPPYPTPEENR